MAYSHVSMPSPKGRSLTPPSFHFQLKARLTIALFADLLMRNAEPMLLKMQCSGPTFSSETSKMASETVFYSETTRTYVHSSGTDPQVDALTASMGRLS
jgi:hypothetical protein